jgi:hypothetical protein
MFKGNGFVEEIVHIIPLSYEIDRAVKPLQRMKANRAYLLLSGENMGKSRHVSNVLKTVSDKLEQMGIEVIVRQGDPSDPLPLLSTISDIIVHEKGRKNLVYVNMSSSGTLTAVSSTLAAMYHDVKVYYVHVDGGFFQNNEERLEHGFSIVDVPECSILTNFTIDMPSGAKSAFLAELRQRGEMTTRDIIAMIKENRLKGFEDLNRDIGGKSRTASNLLVRINRGLLDELAKNGYIAVEKKGRNKVVKLTDKGKYAACLIGRDGAPGQQAPAVTFIPAA